MMTTSFPFPSVKLVLIDDDPAMVRLLAGIIHRSYRHDIEMQPYSDPALAQDCLERELADIVVTDLEMPEINGLEILRLAKSRNPCTQVLLVTDIRPSTPCSNPGARCQRLPAQAGRWGVVPPTDRRRPDAGCPLARGPGWHLQRYPSNARCQEELRVVCNFCQVLDTRRQTVIVRSSPPCKQPIPRHGQPFRPRSGDQPQTTHPMTTGNAPNGHST